MMRKPHLSTDGLQFRCSGTATRGINRRLSSWNPRAPVVVRFHHSKKPFAQLYSNHPQCPPDFRPMRISPTRKCIGLFCVALAVVDSFNDRILSVAVLTLDAPGPLVLIDFLVGKLPVNCRAVRQLCVEFCLARSCGHF